MARIVTVEGPFGPPPSCRQSLVWSPEHVRLGRNGLCVPGNRNRTAAGHHHLRNVRHLRNVHAKDCRREQHLDGCRLGHGEVTAGLTSPAVTVTVNNPYAIFITSPKPGAVVSGINFVVIWWQGAQGAAPSYTITVAGKTVAPSQPARNPQPTSIPWDTTTVANGTQTITVTAVDGAGQITTASVDVTVSNP